ncbi:hypothetical protein [Gudongella oleilytica]|uniref:hypothetical protein n=1 Tax=Gudongella oleilytica TaxID=1582259 RepID=UPI000FF89F97|nr:hypothetical protein [Gudongella oleilytica]
MKINKLVFIILCTLLFTVGCSSVDDNDIPTLVADSNNEISLSPEQQKAVNNSINFIKNSEFASKDRIDTNIITIENADEKTWEFVHLVNSKADENSVDSTDWIITIGERSGHDFARIVCDSDSFEVIGYIPIE